MVDSKPLRGSVPRQTADINPRVAQGISGLFSRPQLADCQLVFVLDPGPRSASPVPPAQKVVGEPLPGHSFVLRFASDKVAAQVRAQYFIIQACRAKCLRF